MSFLFFVQKYKKYKLHKNTKCLQILILKNIKIKKVRGYVRDDFNEAAVSRV